ncbi:MAG: tRNA (adenosine(37)-N6)-threonylcarbamoyltransferase complex ATPase subunit type 1 TsaE, partial [Actinobacteria bacterium]|nr:tRNA (adenosine(37)-N6)-threonylcarbamoyltransferase complex ATPase subunit type 1 TsaE [Actinomycetota bacterium]
ETKKMGESFSKILSGGDVIFLSGELGGGKTTFISGIAEGLKVKGNVSSPSFTLISIYDFIKDKIKLKMIHCDLYRISNFNEIFDIGIEEYIHDLKSTVFIEWGSFLKKKIPAKYLEIIFEYLIDDAIEEENYSALNQKRKITFSAKSPYWKQKLKLFKSENLHETQVNTIIK